MKSGDIVWRIAPCGTTSVMFDRATDDRARVYGRGQRSKWAQRPMEVALADVFPTREEARQEYRRRRAEAMARDPNSFLNFTTPMAKGDQ